MSSTPTSKVLKSGLQKMELPGTSLHCAGILRRRRWRIGSWEYLTKFEADLQKSNTWFHEKQETRRLQVAIEHRLPISETPKSSIQTLKSKFQHKLLTNVDVRKQSEIRKLPEQIDAFEWLLTWLEPPWIRERENGRERIKGGRRGWVSTEGDEYRRQRTERNARPELGEGEGGRAACVSWEKGKGGVQRAWVGENQLP